MWNEQWSHVVGGTELNTAKTGGPLFTEVPQVHDIPDWDIKSVPIDGEYPAYIRADPTSGAYTFQIQGKNMTWAAWDAVLVGLDALFTMGSVLTYTFQVRGMSAAKSVLIVPRGRAVDPTLRKVVYNCYVPVPVPA